MSRNSEKAQSMLYRFRESQAADLGILDIGRSKRPRAIKSVTSLPAAEKWRSQVLKEISRKVTRIHEPSLSAFQLRDLNDDINRAMREKYAWEMHIRELGGPNYARGTGRVLDDEGREIVGAGRGYRYFGRARELPGVKELIDAATVKPRENDVGRAGESRLVVDAAYYGYNLDEEDGELLAYEAEREKEARERLANGEGREVPEGWEPLPGDAGDGVRWALPSMDEVQEELVERRRRKLLQRLD